jgi:hypothetical protein
VGINHYLHAKDAKILPLAGCENDVALMKDTLQNAFGFPETNIKTLIGPQATHEAITGEKGLFRTHLIENAKQEYNRNGKDRDKGALIVFHFSGHGSQIKDQDGDEKDDGKDETILPYDTRDAANRVTDITDDELNDLLVELTQYTANVVMILDSCHSGTASRGDEDRLAREADEDNRVNTYVRKSNVSEEAMADKYVLISGSLSSQRSYERPVKQTSRGKADGLLTYYLSQALWRADTHTTYHELLRETREGIKSEMQDGQDPTIEGDISRKVLSGGSLRGEPYFEIVSDPQGELITFNAGKAHGIREGTQVAIYSREATTFVGENNWLTTATVIKASDFQSTARMAKPAGVTKQSRVVMTAPNYGGEPLGIALNSPERPGQKKVAPQIASDVAKLLNDGLLVQNGLIQLLDQSASTQKTSGVVSLRRAKFGDLFKSNDDLPPPRDCHEEDAPLPPADMDIYYLDEGTGKPMFSFYIEATSKDVASEVAKVIEVRARQQNLLTIAQKSSPLSGDGLTNGTIRVKLEKYPTHTKCVYVEEIKEWRRRLEDDTAQATTVSSTSLERGEVFRFEIQNTSEKSVFVSAFLLGNNGSIKMIYPVTQGSGLLGPGELGPGKSDKTRTLVSARPFGQETLKILVTKVHTDFSFLEQAGVRTRSKGSESALQRLLDQSGIKTRDDLVDTSQPSQWGVVTFDLMTCSTKNEKGGC